jgi:hypothetical protein
MEQHAENAIDSFSQFTEKLALKLHSKRGC